MIEKDFEEVDNNMEINDEEEESESDEENGNKKIKWKILMKKLII